MKIKGVKSLMLCLLACVLLLSGGAHVSAAQTSGDDTRIIQLQEASIQKYGFTNAFYRAVEQANENNALENADSQVHLTVPGGIYTIEHPIQINYSNLYVDFTGCTFIQKSGYVGNLLRIGESNSKRSGYYYHDVTIVGGTFDGNGSGSTLFKTAHAKNILVKNATFKNVVNGHLTEAAGVDGLTFSGCTFQDQRLSASGATLTYEAIQLDILSHEHFSGYLSEVLATKNVVVEDCVFDHVPRGVGSHTAIMNCPLDGIVVKNNIFKNIGSVAVQGHNWVNVTVSGNDISGCPRGVAMYVLQATGTYLPSDIAAEDGTSTVLSDTYHKPSANQKIVITNNKIDCSGKDQYASYAPVGIYVGGLKLTRDTKMTKGSVIPKGDYFISGVTIKNNNVRSVGNGVRLEDVRKASVMGNTFQYIGKAKGEAYHGIQLRLGSQSDCISKNTVCGYNTNGIYLNTSSKTSKIVGNKITNVGKYGIGIEESTAGTIGSNVIKKAKVYGIGVVIKSKVSKISANKISGCGEKIHVTADSKVKS